MSSEKTNVNPLKVVQTIRAEEIEKLEALSRIYERTTSPDDRAYNFNIFLTNIGKCLDDVKTIEFDNSCSPVEHAKAVEEAIKKIDSLITRLDKRLGQDEIELGALIQRVERLQSQVDLLYKGLKVENSKDGVFITFRRRKDEMIKDQTAEKPVGEMTDAEIEAEAERRVGFSDVAVRDIMQRIVELLNEKTHWPEVGRFAQAVGRESRL